MSTGVRATADAYVGLDAATPDAWAAWHAAMRAERARVRAEARLDLSLYDDPATAWSDRCFRQVFLFMYDAAFYEPERRRYRSSELVARWERSFGRVDSVLLWHAYPRLGFDRRTQFDFYRQMPGGLGALRSDVVDVFHAAGIRVFVDYNPWDAGSYDELGEIVAALDADGVMLDTMTDAPDTLLAAVSARRPGVVFAPERRPRDADLGLLRQSWAQWYDVGDAATPSIYRHRWIAPRHRQLAIRRWDRSRRGDVVYSFFNGSGLILWENVFGCWNPCSRGDRRLVAETAAAFERYGDLFAAAEWLPLVPTGVSGLDANRWDDGPGGRAIVTLRNRTARALAIRWSESAPAGRSWVALWGERAAVDRGDAVVVEPAGVQALVLDAPDRAAEAREHVRALGRRADVDRPADDVRTPSPRLVPPPSSPTAAPAPPSPSRAPVVELPGGDFTMRIVHERRECGCYPLGAGPDALWGWFYKDEIRHEIRTRVERFAIRRTVVKSGEFLEFVHASGYRPSSPARFLAHLSHLRAPDGGLPRSLSADDAAQPVTFVSLADARAYAAWHGERLPTEAEWQLAAETADGVLGLSGGAWELTESEHDDGHTRFVMLRGGAPLPPGESEWLVARGPRTSDSHAKYILLDDGLDRSEAISFRTVRGY